MGALVIQEEGTLQVRLKKDTPRVYRIRFDALEEYEERFWLQRAAVYIL